jgi:two-component system, chemotaxis family, sensor kinase CheA
MQEALSARKAESQSTDLETQELLLFRTSRGRRTAVALSSVDRLEEFKIAQFELAGQKLVVQYRGQLLPIVNLSDKFDAVQAGTEDALLKVLVCSHEGERMGIVVDQILDVAQEAVSLQERWKDSQSQGSAVIQKQVTDFLDLKAMMASAQGGAMFSENSSFSENLAFAEALQ